MQTPTSHPYTRNPTTPLYPGV